MVLKVECSGHTGSVVLKVGPTGLSLMLKMGHSSNSFAVKVGNI